METKLVVLKRDLRPRIGNYFFPKGSLLEIKKWEGDWWKYEVPGKPIVILVDDRDFRDFVWKPIKIKRRK